MKSKKSWFWSGIVVAMFLVAYPVLAAETTTTGTQTAEARPVSVDMRNSLFIPQVAVVQQNLSVTWTNKDTFAHDVTFPSKPAWDSPRSMGEAATYALNATEVGVFDYFCTLHSTGPGNGMWGRLVVTPAPFLPLGTAGGGEHFDPEEIGVKWLAHWVGIVSFVAVFVTLIIYYFVLKYGESVHTTDHRDRKEK